MFGMPGGWEWIIILIVAILIFGKRLPEVMKSLGKGIVEFKKGVKGVEDDVEDVSSKSPQSKKKIDIENDTAKQEKNS
ncbi:Sec-independent protein translocase protein TatA [Candidatus Kuenenia stuttgartiensis]|jgi:sec-independent protein translocase protein TatA|uniref:Sec-independent protein translocase protein TatA n=1 Tax=Kuenenia stuttgartiensis TaxID=174633 RepID=Q1Q688_KUEST|nr:MULTISPECIES: twin-arginine translocase TatA/TatE family subunit [Kuenenia]MBE7548334.1 twin-arginine translocase TatA/TatE family subunit [Planctomycetia bacterium]MBW7941094.1 twin-arginine translocase TatA/TatE family subunit [Candidatus Kuenenia stuttgartiensis]MBZ0192756.1 twin-arginine translocase TatA/TatE family subunit [Candidatus Kuenenia stuttgartiensis]MCF6153221.1 twin-arginine translocase TatA/TatE family subunit [Candidatus Kuenenia stuttgartiensis]MCL4726793.1 twin-arginine 